MSHAQGWSQARYVARGVQCISTPQVLGLTDVPHYTWLMVHVALEMKPWSLYMPGYIELHPEAKEVISE